MSACEVPIQSGHIEHSPNIVANDCLTLQKVLEVVAQTYGVPVAALVGRNRRQRIAWIRQVAMTLSYELVDRVSLSEVSELYGHRHHTTVVYARNVVHNFMALEPRTRETIESLRARLKP